jgi:DNA-binding transcriptional MerR regulator/quercetin dioxygenase-like cupin family protein
LVREQNGNRYYTVGDVAKAIGVSRQTLRVWERRGLLAPLRSQGRQRLYGEADLERASQIALLRNRHGWNPAALQSWTSAGHATTAWGSLHLGMRIRVARRSRKITLTHAARMVGVSSSFLSSLERGETGVSQHILSKIAEALSMPPSAFAPVWSSPALVMRPVDRPQTDLADGVRWQELASRGHRMEPAMLMVPSGASSQGFYSHKGETFLHVIAGSFTLLVLDGDEQRLRAGDSLVLSPGSTWSWRNHGRVEARILWVEELQEDAWA